MRIRILGGNCSGKTTFASSLSKQIKTPVYSLDDIQFLEKFSKMREVKKRIKILDKICSKKNWIIEGTQRSEWTYNSVKRANIIIILKTSMMKQYYRVTVRWLKRIFNKTHKESIRGLFELYGIIYNYDNPNHSRYEKKNKLLKNSKAKIMIVKNNQDLCNTIAHLKATCKTL